MSEGNLLIERDGAVAVITINRPEKRNALNSAVRGELVTAFAELERDGAIRVVVLTGAGEQSFAAGADIAEFARRSSEEQRAAMAEPTVFDAIASCAMPTIAMINGFALGGGCELALTCDLRIAASSARLGQPEISLGLIPGGGGTQRLPRLVGTGRTMWLVLSGEIIDAAEAHRIGLVDVVVPDSELRDRTLRVAHRLAAKSPLALRSAKSAVRAASELPLSAGLAHERELFLTCFGSEDGREGIAAFIEKRPASFRGR